MRGSLVTEYPSCSTCIFLSVEPNRETVCRRLPPFDKYGTWPPIAFPNLYWCGEHTTKQGPAERVDVPFETLFPPLKPPEPVDPKQPTPDPTPTDAPQVLPLSTPTRKRNR